MTKILIVVGILLMVGIASADSYVYGNGERVAKVNESGIFYYHSDHLGSTSAVTNSKGEVVEEQVNLPFGEPVSGNEKHGFTGKEHDETGLQYFGARYYDPLIAKFINVDPLMDGINWFSYANNNPLRFIDPDGRATVEFIYKEKTKTYKALFKSNFVFYGEQDILARFDDKAVTKKIQDDWNEPKITKGNEIKFDGKIIDEVASKFSVMS